MEIDIKIKNLFNNEYIRVGSYIGCEVPIEIRHNTCGNTYLVKPHTLLRANIDVGKCPWCFRTRNTTQDQFLWKLKQVVGDEYELVGEYVNMNTHTIIKHNLCSYEFSVKPHFFISKGTRCPWCAKKGFIYSTEIVRNEIHDLTNGEYVMVGEYVNEKIPFMIKHEKCGKSWNVRRRNFIYNNTRCPYCYSMSNRSKIEEIINQELLNIKEEFLTSKDIKFEECHSGNRNYLEFDFYLPRINLLIEYDGKQHFFKRNKESPNSKFDRLYNQVKNDWKKNEWCSKYLINFVRFSYLMKPNEILASIHELIQNGELSSTTIEKNVIYFQNENSLEAINCEKYYTNIREDYFINVLHSK
jgi:hypothetical protein